MPQISVIIPTYNRADLLPLAIRSVQTQRSAEWELIIVDDGSTDTTEAVVQSFLHDPHIRYVYQPNAGRSAARNAGAALARHDWLVFLDSDDELTPDALAYHLAAADSRSVGMLIGGVDMVDVDGQLLQQQRPWQTHGSLDLDGWLFNCYGQPSSVAIHRDWFARTNGFLSQATLAEDWKLYLDLAALGCPMEWTKAQVCRYRQHPANSTHAIQRHLKVSLDVLASMSLYITPSRLQQAHAWMHVVAAKRFFAADQPGAGREAVYAAFQLDGTLASARATDVVEMLLIEGADVGPIVHALRAAGIRPKTIRIARARVAMSHFFQQQHDRTLARRNLRAGLTLDPRWLFNRGVLSYLLRAFKMTMM